MVEMLARRAAIVTIHAIGGKRSYSERFQAWTLPAFIFFAVIAWFLLVQFSFSFILWALKTEPNWSHAFSSSGSALSTLGYLTPSTLLGEYLATYEAAIGLVIVILLFTFVPNYQTAIQVRERKVGWLYARTGLKPTAIKMLESTHRLKNIKDTDIWEGWENWFRTIFETHSIFPILAYSPSVYEGTNWVCTSASILDATSLLIATAEQPDDMHALHICRDTGIMTIKTIAKALYPSTLLNDEWYRENIDANRMVDFDQLYDQLANFGLTLNTDKAACKDLFIKLRSEYEVDLRYIAKSTRMSL